MEEFKVSVIIPVYNASKYLVEAVDSALLQPEVGEVILIEDASPDKSLSLCLELESKHKEVHCFQHEDKKNHGAGPSRNLGISKAKYSFISFLDADDFYTEERFNKTKKVFNTYPEATGVYECLGTFLEDKKQIESNRTTMSKKVDPQLLFETLMKGEHGHIHLDTITLKKSSINELRFSDIRISQDVLFIWMISLKGRLLPGEINNPVAFRRVHSENRYNQSIEKLYKYQVIAYKMLIDWIQNNNLDPQYVSLAERAIYNREIDINGLKTFPRRELDLIKTLKISVKNPRLLFTKQTLKLFLNFFGMHTLLRNKAIKSST